MFRNPKKALLAFAVAPTLFGMGGCGDWDAWYRVGYHLSDLTQWWAALNQLGIV